MHPAFSVIAFTTLSGAGYGLLVMIALSVLTAMQPARALLALLLLALVMVTTGLLSSLAHLGKPLRAWRSFSQWRSSWLSREGVMAVLTYLPALALGALLLPQAIAADDSAIVQAGNAWGIAAGVVTIACALATTVCTAMIYASLKPIPAWRHRLVVPIYLAFSLLTGSALLAAGMALAGDTGLSTRLPAAASGLGAVLVLMLKWRYWRDIDRTPLTVTRGDAVGLPGRDISVFERPHTDANYLTREMGFVVARKHARKLRMIALGLAVGVPILAAGMTLLLPGSAPVILPLAALAVLAGTAVERWLFFAEAKHLVTLYY